MRVDHNTADFSKYDMVIDISRRYDGKKFFDHHSITDVEGRRRKTYRLIITLMDPNKIRETSITKL